MKSLSTLKILIDLFLFFALLGALSVIIALPVKLIYPDVEIPLKMGGIAVGNDWLSIFVIILAAAGTFFFIYAIFLLRKVLQLFSKNQIFTASVVKYFGTIGKCIIASTVLTSIPLFFYKATQDNTVDLNISAGFDSLVLSISLGLLFIVIGEIFRKAIQIKEENELTV